MLSENLNYYLKLKNINLSQLSKLGKVSYGRLHELSSGKTKNLSLDNAAKIAKALDITIDELYYGKKIEMRCKK